MSNGYHVTLMKLGHKRARFVNAVTIAGIVVLLGSTAAWASTKTAQDAQTRQAQINKQVATLRDQVSEASQEETAVLTQLDAIDSRKRPLVAAIASLDGDIARVEGELAAAEHVLEQRQVEVQAGEDHLADVKAQVEALRTRIQRRAVGAYVSGSDFAATTVLFERRSARDSTIKKGYDNALSEAEAREMRDLKSLEDQAKQLTINLATAREIAARQLDSVASQRADLQARRNDQEVLRQQVLVDEASTQALLKGVQQRKDEFQSQIAALSRESDSITALLRQSEAGQGNTVSGKGVLATPIPGARLSSPFGPRVHPIFGDVRMHTGQDFAATTGTPIRAAADGVVVFAGVRGGYGNATIIDHGGSLATLYAHQSRFRVATGDVVKRGQIIGEVGSTGYATGPHLHFETRVQGVPVNPLNYL